MPKVYKPEDVTVEMLFVEPRKRSRNPGRRGLLKRAYNVCIGEYEKEYFEFHKSEVQVPIRTAKDLLGCEIHFASSGQNCASLRRISDKKAVRIYGLGAKVAKMMEGQLKKFGFELKTIGFVPSVIPNPDRPH